MHSRKTPIHIVVLVAVAALLPLSPTHSLAQSGTVSYQGQLNTGANPANGVYDFEFTLYDSPSNMVALDSVVHLGTEVSNGLFTVLLDFDPALWDGADRWLGIGTRTNGDLTFEVLSPRQPVVSTPYAIKAATAEVVDGATITEANIAPGGVHSLDASDGDPVDAVFVDSSGNVGVGLTSPNEKLEVAGRILLRDPANNGALILSPSTTAVGFDPELVIQAAETGGGNDAPFHISRNAIFQTSDDSYQYIDVSGNEASKIEFAANGDIKLSSSTNGTGQVFFQDNVVIKADGKVGVGLGSPSAQLDVLGDVRINDGSAAAGHVLTAADATGLATWAAGGDTDWTDDGANVYRTSGNVGVGTSTPGFALEVAGTLRADKYFGGADDNQLSGNNNMIGSGSLNTNTGNLSGLVSGTRNRIEGSRNFIGGGRLNTIGAGSDNGIGSGQGNRIIQNGAGRGFNSFIGGGRTNYCSQNFAVIGGGRLNIITNNDSDNIFFCTIGGGDGNFSSACSGTIAGGWNNTNISGFAPTVAGGRGNTADKNYSTVGGGRLNSAIAIYATIPGGRDNEASGDYSFAAGRRAKAINNGTFVWADNSNADLTSTAANQFTARAAGGVRFFSNAASSSGTQLAPGANSWASISDRNAKKNFHSVDGREVLDQLVEVPIQRWNYRSEPDEATQHIGPMAQDFKAAFYPGRDDKTISTLEFDGVALAAIQGLNQKLEQENNELRARLAALEQVVAKLANTERTER